MKKCSKCNEVKTSNEFYVKNKKTGLLQSCCIQCHKVVSRKHYEENKELVKRRSKNSKGNIKPSRQKIILEYLKSHPCDCGESRPILLEFHHIDPVTKSFNVANSLNLGKKALLNEIEKCKVLCVSCHRIMTHEQWNSYKWKDYMGL